MRTVRDPEREQRVVQTITIITGGQKRRGRYSIHNTSGMSKLGIADSGGERRGVSACTK